MDKQAITLAYKYAEKYGYEGEVAEVFVSAFVEDFEKGEKIGIEKNKIEMAKKMLSKGLDISDIAEFTGLSISEIKNQTSNMILI